MGGGMDRWRNKVAIVTGASSGIGAAIAESLVNEGLVVAGLARRKENVERLAEKLKEKPGKLHAIRADMSKEEDIDAAFQWVKDNLGPVHVLINNAGLAKPHRFIDSNSEDWREVVDVNFKAVCLTTRKAIKDMKENKIDGHIIQISSVLGHVLPFGFDINIYPVTKHAVRALTEITRQELIHEKSNIKISNISPGYVDTGIMSDNQMSHILESFEASRKLAPNDVAELAVYMLSTPPHVQIQDVIIKPLGEAF